MASTVQRVVDGARTEAVRQGARTVEAEHLLLALALEPDCAAVLDQAGLDEPALRAALHDEWTASLAAAGVEQAIPEPGAVDRNATPRIGESFKLALTRGVAAGKAQRSRRTQGLPLLLGVVSARQGTVPRALALTGVPDLRERVEHALQTSR